MTPEELKTRASNIISNQLMRSATSVGANYRAACRARSKADFISKIGITLEEADESVYWMELIAESKMRKPAQLVESLAEGKQLVAIFIASSNTAHRQNGKAKR